MRHEIVWATIACAAFGLSACSRKAASTSVQSTTSIQRNGEPVLLTGRTIRETLPFPLVRPSGAGPASP